MIIDTCGLTSSCRHVGSRKQCKSDQPASTLVSISSHFVRDPSVLHDDGAWLTVPWKVLKWNRCVPSLPVSRPNWISCNIDCSNSKPNRPRHARRLRLVMTSRSFVPLWILASWRRSLSLTVTRRICSVALHLRGNVRSSGFGRGAEAVYLVDSRRGKPQRLRSAARGFSEEQGCVLSPCFVVQRPSAGSCPRSAEAWWTRGTASDGPFEPQVSSRLNAMLVGVLSPVWRQGRP